MHMSNSACPPRERSRKSTWYFYGSVETPQILSMRAPNPLKLAYGTRHRILAPLEALFFKQTTESWPSCQAKASAMPGRQRTVAQGPSPYYLCMIHSSPDLASLES